MKTMLNVVFLSPHFPNNLSLFCQRLNECGIGVLGLDHVHHNSLPTRLQTSLKDYYRVSDLHNFDELRQALDYFMKTHGPIHCIESHNEYWLETQARLGAEFQIPGLKQESIEKIKRKSEMKKVFNSLGLKPARGELVSSLEHAKKVALTLGFPVILKPDIGVGAKGCVKIESDIDLETFFREKRAEAYLMEEFVDGQIFSFDGLVDQTGKILFCTSHVYGAGIAEVVQQKLDQVYYSLKTIPHDIEEAGRSILKAYELKGRFFHLEFFRKHEDHSLVPIEVNMRPPGGATIDMCNFACDIDLYRLWAEMLQRQDSMSFTYDRMYHCMSISRRNTRSYLHSHEEVLKKCSHAIVHHDSVSPLFHETMGSHFYLVRAKKLETLYDLQHFILQAPAFHHPFSEVQS